MKQRAVIGAVAVAAVAAGVWAWVANRDSGESLQGSATAAAPAVSQGPRIVAPTPLVTVASGVMHDTWLLKPPAGAKVAVYEFDDLECPVCARAIPIVRAAVEHYKVPVVHRDYPLTEIHVWSFQAAVTARYIEDRISPQLADEFRKDVFANQSLIANKDDLARFTGRWFQAHNRSLPFVMDPSGACQNEVKADRALGDRIGVGVHGTPCIFVVTPQSATLVVDVNQIGRMIEVAMAQTRAEAQVVEDVKQRS